MDVTVKTLDGQNKNYSIPDDMTVRQFKEKIADSINIEADTQRLIFHGRVLQDEKLLKEYDVSGKVIHVVQRAPPSSRPDSATNDTAPTTTNSQGGNPRSVVVGSFTLPTDILDPNQVQNIVQNAVAGMGDQWRNARVSTVSTGDGSPIDVRINLGQIPPQTQDHGQGQVNHIRRTMRQVRRLIDSLENTTTEQSSDVGSSTPESNMDASPEAPATPSEPNTQETDQTSASASNNSTQSGRPSLRVMADLLDEVRQLNISLQPYLDQYRDILQEDASLSDSQATQRMCNVVSEAMHGMSHIYHGMSDFMVDLSQPSPRHLYSPPTSSFLLPPPMVQRTQINVSNGRPNRQNSGTPASNRNNQPSSTNVPNAATSTTASTTGTSTSTNTSTSTTSGGQANGAAGSNLPPGVSVAGSSDPYVYFEVGPDSVTLNSISAHVITSAHDTTTQSSTAAAQPNTQNGNLTGAETRAQTTAATSSTPSAGPTPTSTPQASTNLPDLNIPGMPPGFVQNIMQSVLQSQGGRPRHPVQINVVPLNIGNAGVPVRVVGMRPNQPGIHANMDIRMTSRPVSSTGTNRTSAMSTNPLSALSTNPLSATSTNTTSATSTNPTSATATPTPTSTVTFNTTTSSTAPASVNTTSTTNTGQDGLGEAMFNSMPGRPVDPYLPCSSRHYLTQQARNAGTAARQPNPEAGLSEMVSGLMSGLLGVPGSTPNIHIHRGPPPMSAGSGRGDSTTQQRSQSASSTPAGVRLTGAPGINPGGSTPTQEAFRQTLLNMFESTLEGHLPSQRAQATSTTSTGSTAPGSQRETPTSGRSQPPSNFASSNAMFLELFQGITRQFTDAASGQQSNGTIHDFLGNLSTSGQGDAEEGFVNDLFQMISGHLSFSDLFQVLSGRADRLDQLQGPLKEFCKTRILKGKDYNEDNLSCAIEEIINEMSPELEAAVSSVEVKEGIDLMTTLKNFLRHQLRVTVRSIMTSESADSAFGRNIYERVRRLLGEFIILTPLCLVEGNAAFERMLQSRLQNMMSTMNPMIQQWMVNMTTQHLQTFRQSVVITQAEVEHYIIRKEQASTAGAAATTRATRSEVPMEVGSPPSSMPKPATTLNKIEEAKVSSKTNSTPKVSSTIPPSPIRSTVNGVSSSGVASPTPGLTAQSVDMATNGEDWRAVLPEEWVPMISQDIQRQKHNRPQPPLSDAYLQGMPAKRRKVMTSDRPCLTNMGEYIPESIRQAASALGIEPISSVENMTQEASSNNELHNALTDEIDRTIVKRLEKDSDYIPDRYPNAEQCYKPRKSER